MKLSLNISLILSLSLSCHALATDNRIEINAKQVNQQCFSSEWKKRDLLSLKKNKFVIVNQDKKEQLALQLLNCLANPDPEIRDGIAFEAISHWLRNDKISHSVYIEMFEALTNALEKEVSDPAGVYQSFSMLVLSEVARVDRKSPFLTDKQRSYLVNIGSHYLTNLRDYRGFSSKVGWRHGIAHSADLMLQLALNPAVNKSMLDKVLQALSSQITAHDLHSYTQGEPKRIAMAVIYIFLRGEHNIDEWGSWIKKLSEPAPFNQWQNVYQSEKGLVKLHNTQSFLYALYAIIKPSKNETLVGMIPQLEQAIKEVQ
jgi:hypothetical protein